MGYIKFKNKETVQKVIVSEESPHVIRITGDNLVVNTDGFSLYLDEDCKYPLDNGEYEAYNTLFREGDGWYELSDDGSVYVERLHRCNRSPQRKNWQKWPNRNKSDR